MTCKQAFAKVCGKLPRKSLFFDPRKNIWFMTGRQEIFCHDKEKREFYECVNATNLSAEDFLDRLPEDIKAVVRQEI